MSYTIHHTTLVASCVWALAMLVGCSTNVGLDGTRDGGDGSDAAISPRTDVCGNGLDDDANGRIDDGCPCGPGETQTCYGGSVGNRRVGTCTDGLQRCHAAGSVEWGDWGDSACEGDIRPSEEMCDGMDHDCDGAADEGCPCSDGEARPCGVPELVTAPCMGGTQSCSADGTWTSCDGAVGPSADVCGDHIDNDCNGTTDDSCMCVPTAELCRDGVDNDCDGVVDEPACMPDWPPADGGVPDGGSPDGGVPEGCTGDYPDFRDRILWETLAPGAGHFIASVGSPGQSAWLGGSGSDTVTLDLRPLYSPTAFSFGSFVSSEWSLGRLSFGDGTPLTLVGRSRSVEVDVTAGHVAMGGLFSGTLDIGAGAWTSDPTLYTASIGPPVAAPDLFWARGSEATDLFSSGAHYAVTGIPSTGMPGSFEPFNQINLANVDERGNTYLGGSFEAVLNIGGLVGDSTLARPITHGWARFVASLDASGSARWLRTYRGEQQAEGAVDPTGRYLVTTGYLSPIPQHPVLELLDAATGITLFRHEGSSNAPALIAYDVDSAGNVFVSGRTMTTAFTLGALTVSPNRAFVASFDAGGALRWSHVMFDSTFPAVVSAKQLLSAGEGRVALLVELSIQSTPIDVDIAGCTHAIDKRWYPRGPETGVATSTRPSSYWEVHELLVAVLDSTTGDLRWVRRIDSITDDLSLEIHPSGDVLLVMHNKASMAKVSYRAGLTANATHVFRLRGD